MDQKTKIMIHSAGMIAIYFVQWLISALLVRMGGYYEAGVFSLAMTISNVFTYIGNFGIRTFMLADGGRTYTQKQYRGASICTITASYIFCAGYLLIAGHYTTIEWASILVYLTYSNLFFYSDILFGKIQLCGRLELNGFSNMIRSVLCFTLFILSYIVFRNILVSLFCMAIASGLVLLFYDSRYYRNITEENAFKNFSGINESRGVIIQCIPIMLTLTLPLITTAIPRGMIQKEYGTELLGYFSTIFTPAVLISVIVPNILQGILPDLADNWNKNALGKVKKLICIEIAVIVLITGAAALLTLLIGKQIMRIVFGEEILPYFPLLYWAILTTGINSLVGIGNNMLIVMKANKQLILASALAIVVCAVFSYLWIGKWSLYGATYALLIAYSAQILFQWTIIGIRIYQRERQP